VREMDYSEKRVRKKVDRYLEQVYSRVTLEYSADYWIVKDKKTQQNLISRSDQIALRTSEIDLIILPYFLENQSHYNFSEIDRILTADGYLVVFGQPKIWKLYTLKKDLLKLGYQIVSHQWCYYGLYYFIAKKQTYGPLLVGELGIN